MSKHNLVVCETCGGEAILTTCSNELGEKLYFVICNSEGIDGRIMGCGSQTTHYKNEEDAIKSWNTWTFDR